MRTLTQIVVRPLRVKLLRGVVYKLVARFLQENSNFIFVSVSFHAPTFRSSPDIFVAQETIALLYFDLSQCKSVTVFLVHSLFSGSS